LPINYKSLVNLFKD